MTDQTGIQQLLEIMACLRDPQQGCPWDLQQNFNSIAPYTLEEAYEVVDTIERNDLMALQGELGDLLFQVVFHSQLAKEQGLFEFKDVVAGINEKMIRRHPHVFAEQAFASEEAIHANWEAEKQKERQAKGGAEGSILEAVTLGLPALKRAAKLQKKAAKTGFDWPEPEPIFDKIQEELQEVKEELAAPELDPKALEGEIGDLLFAVVNLARHYKVDPEQALRTTNQKFCTRFAYIEKRLAEQGLTPEQASLEQMDLLWEQAKGKPS